MKELTIILLFFTFVVQAQENPWENKNKENPWKTSTKKMPENTVERDTVVVLQSNDTVYTETLSEEQKVLLIRKAENQARDNYRKGGAFTVGFCSGFILNYIGLLPSAIYLVPTSKKEKQAVEQVETDSTYAEIDPELLQKKTKNAVKSKKALNALGGVVVGSLAQIGVILGIIALN